MDGREKHLRWEHIVKQYEARISLDVSCDEFAGGHRGFSG
jgi:hypothetical protein